MLKCQSCGMPMEKPEDHGGARPGNPYCQYCTDAQGNLLSREEVRDKMIKYHTQVLSKSQEEAERFVDEQMKEMPAWEAVAGEPAGGGEPVVDRPAKEGSGGVSPAATSDEPSWKTPAAEEGAMESSAPGATLSRPGVVSEEEPARPLTPTGQSAEPTAPGPVASEEPAGVGREKPVEPVQSEEKVPTGQE